MEGSGGVAISGGLDKVRSSVFDDGIRVAGGLERKLEVSTWAPLALLALM